MPKSINAIVPFNGLNYNIKERVDDISKFPTLADLQKEEMMKDMMEAMDGVDMKKKPEKPEFWVFDKFSKNVDLLFLTKVLLKIIVFKKIIKFIALVCLLFFLPAIKDDTDLTTVRKLDPKNTNVYDKIDYRSKQILDFAVRSLEAFTFDKMVWCVAEHDAFCRFEFMFDVIDQTFPIDYMIRLWYPKSTTKILKFLNKYSIPKPNITASQEPYLQLPEDEVHLDSSEMMEISEDDEPDDDSVDSDDEDNELED